MRQLIDVFNTGDLRHLLIDYDESFNLSILLPVFDNLMIEFEELKGSDEYQSHIQKQGDRLWKGQIINACNLCIIALSHPFYNKEQAQKLIDSYNLKIKLDKTIRQKKAIERLERKIRQIITTIKISDIQENENKTEHKITWEELRVYIHSVLQVLPEYNCTVSQYLAYEKQAKLMVKQHGKRD